METLKSFLHQALMIWKESTGAGRLGIALLVIICVGGILGVGIWSAQPDYVKLVEGTDATVSAKIVEKLDASGISYKLQGAGAIILVDRRKWSEATMAASDVGVEPARESMEEMSVWQDPFAQQDIRRRNKERQLEASVARLSNVVSAEVLLGEPKEQKFLRGSHPTTASVIVEIVKKARFDESHASAVANIVADGTPGLTSDMVSVTDTNGIAYSTDDSFRSLSRQTEIRISRDRELAQKAEMLLNKIVGYGNASVEVTTEFSYPNATTTTKIIDSENRVLIKEDIENVKRSGAGGTALGTAGTATNGGGTGTTARSNRGDLIEDMEKNKSEYMYGNEEMVTIKQDPVLEMVSVSVLVNKTSVEDENKVVPQDVKDSIQEIVSNAIGIKPDRDQITVGFQTFVETVTLDEPAAAGIPWDQVNQIIKNVSLGLAALVALYISLRALKKFQLEPGPTTEVAARSDHMDQLSEMVQQNPEIFSKIIANWSDNPIEGDSATRKAA